MNNHVRYSTRGAARRVCALAAFAMFLALGQARTARAQWATSGSNINNTNTGNVGVGTATPGAKLDVTFDGSIAAGLKVFDTRPAGAEFGGHLLFYGFSSGAGGAARFGQIGGLKENATGGSTHGFLGFYTNAGAGADSVVERMRISSAGHVGIGTSDPSAARLVVVRPGSGLPGDAGGSTLAGVLAASTATTGTAAQGIYGYGNVLSVTNATATGVRGLGEALNPYEGQTAYGGFFTGKAGHAYGYTRSAYGLYAKGEMTGASVGSAYGGYFVATGGSTNATTNYAVYASAAGNGTSYGIYSAAGVNFFSGNVGIGTAAPMAALHVPTGQVVIGQNLYQGATLRVGRNDAMFPGIITATNYNDGAKPIYRARSYHVSGLSGDGLYTFLAQNDGNVRTFSADHLGNGYFAGRLDAAGGLCMGGDCKTSWSQVTSSQWTTAGSGIHYGAGNVGVGTSSPDQKLSVQGMLGLNPQPWVMPSTRGMFFFHGGSEGVIYAYNYPAGSPDPLRITGETLSLRTFVGGGGVDRVTVANGGNVGIGTTTPAERLHVEGNLKVTGNIEAKYQDVAEWVPSAQKLAAGTVVVLDPARSNHVLASASSYDTSVAGVVSERPGLILGEGGEGRVMVATTGRVKVRVDATKGAIKIGDLLVTSDVPGVAMRSEPLAVGGRRIHAPGTIIGKALEPLARGVGEILVLLSLQ